MTHPGSMYLGDQFDACVVYATQAFELRFLQEMIKFYKEIPIFI
jgi:hypothetical protein